MIRRNPLKHSLVVIGILLGFLSTSMAYGSTRVFVQNNTTKDLWFNTTSTLNGSFWNNKTTQIKSGGRAEIFETNRDEGVKDGQTYFFTTEVTVKDPANKGQNIQQHQQKFALGLQLKGSTVGSHMWQSVNDQMNQRHGWHDDRTKRNAKMQVGNRQWNVKYWAFFTGTDDNVEYVFQEEYPLPEGSLAKMSYEREKHHLNVLSYNIYMRPTPTHGTPLAPGTNAGMGTFFNGQSIRAGMIPKKIPGYDVVVLQEAFDDGVREKLLNLLKQEYPYQSRILGSDRGLEQDGGVIILSKWPIVNGQGQQRFFGDACSGWDCWAEKGVLYVKINKALKPGETNYFHIFGTHMNAGDWDIQQKQLTTIKQFINAQSIPSSEPVLIAGDFNIDIHNGVSFPGMLKILDAGYMEPAFNQLRGHPYTHDGPLNDLGSGSQSYYDYVLYSKAHVKITKDSFAEVRMLRANDEWKEFPHETAMWDLSDHFPVYASMHFYYDPLENWDPGLVTAELTRFWNSQTQDVAAVATKPELDAVKNQGYQRVGAHGLLFRTEQAADQWSKSSPPDSGGQIKQSSTPRTLLQTVRPRGIPEGNEGPEGIIPDMEMDSANPEVGDDIVKLEENEMMGTGEVEDASQADESQETLARGPEGEELVMEPGLQDAKGIVERGIKRKARPNRSITKPVQKGSGNQMVTSKTQGRKLTVKPIVPLNLYNSAKFNDYFSTTSVVRGQQAMQGAGQYQHIGVQGYVLTQSMYQKLPNSLRSRTIPMYSYYNSQTQDHLIATSPGDIQDAQTRGYKQVALEGYLIKSGPLPPNSCKVNTDCQSGFFCDTKRKVCAPDIR